MALDSSTPATGPRGWPLYALGVLLFLLGPIANGVQLAVLRQTTMPWPMLILTSGGVVLMALSLWRRFSVPRTIGTGVFLLLVGLECFLLFGIARLPQYTGPVRTDAKLPSFETTLADGRAFANRDFKDSEATILLFYRGHW